MLFATGVRLWFTAALLSLVTLQSQTNVLTYHNDLARTGQNLKETILTPANVRSSGFGKVSTLPVDGDVYAQPLYMENVAVAGGGTHNVVFVATEHDSVYAFDADGPGTTPLWHTSFINSATGVRPVLASNDVQCGDLIPEIGITGTPVIDPNTGTLYVVSATHENSGIVDRLHALDITTGAEKFGGPIIIQASVPGTGGASVGGRVPFDPAHAMQRPGLLLLNGSVVIAFASYCDNGTYHGWVLSYNAQTLGLQYAFTPTPNSTFGGIWQSGVAPASDGNSIFLSTGNGGFDANTGGSDYGDSILRLTSQLQVADWFTPYNQATLNQYDLDVSSAGSVLLPDQTGNYPHLMVASGKSGTLYLIDRDAMGGFHAGSNSQIVGSVPNAFASVYGGFAYWNQTVYGAGVFRWNGAADVPKAFSLQQNQLTLASQATTPYGYPGATPSISANGTTHGILWAAQTDKYGSGPAILHAYDATNLATELYNSSQAGSRDQMGVAVKFVVPTIADGRVYVGAHDEVDVFGLLGTASPDFTVALTPTASTVAPNTAASLTLNTSALNGDTATLNLTCTAPASGCTLSPAALAPGQSATVTISAATLQSGTNTVTVSASDGTNTHTTSATVTVGTGLPQPAITNLTATSVTLSWTTAQPLNTQVWYGTSQPSTQLANWLLTTQHSITVTGLSPNTTYQVQTESSYYSNPDLTSPVFTLTTAAAAPPPPAPNFTLALAPAASAVAPGTDASLTLNSTALNGDNSPLTLTCTAPASGCTLSPATINPGQSATVSIAAAALQSGTNPVTVSATDGINTHTASASLTVSAGGGLALPVVSSLSSSSFTLTWNTSQPLNTQVWYGTSQPSSQLANWLLTTQHSITVSGLSPNTAYQVQIESSYYSDPDLVSAVFVVTTLAASAPADFAAALIPTVRTVGPNTAAGFTLTTTALNGDTATLNLTCTAPASGCAVSPASINPGQSAAVSISAASLQTGSNPVTISASDGSRTHTASATVTVSATTPPDFTLALSPATSTASPGTAASLSLTSVALGGDTATLNLTCTAPASGCTVSPAFINPGQSAAVSINAAALQSGPNPVTISASDGSHTHTASAVITVSATPAGLPLPVVSQLTSTSATLTWTTSQALNTQAWYGTSQPSAHVWDWTLTTQHSITLTGLQPNTTYFVQTESSYYSDPDLTSNGFTITTTP